MSSEKIFRRISGLQKTHPTDGFACYQPYECVEDYALSTAPDLKHLVQTCMDFVTPLTFALTLLTLEFQILLDLL